MPAASPHVSKFFFTGTLSLLLLCMSAAANADGNIAAGRQKALMCDACHGQDGHSRVPEVPNLSGQVEGYLLKQLHSFKSGERKNEQMAVIAQSLSPQAMEDLAAYFSAIEIKLVKVPGE